MKIHLKYITLRRSVLKITVSMFLRLLKVYLVTQHRAIYSITTLNKCKCFVNRDTSSQPTEISSKIFHIFLKSWKLRKPDCLSYIQTSSWKHRVSQINLVTIILLKLNYASTCCKNNNTKGRIGRFGFKYIFCFLKFWANLEDDSRTSGKHLRIHLNEMSNLVSLK